MVMGARRTNQFSNTMNHKQQKLLGRKLNRAIFDAEEREYAGDHLSTEEKAVLVGQYKIIFPKVILPEDVNEAYLAIIN